MLSDFINPWYLWYYLSKEIDLSVSSQLMNMLKWIPILQTTLSVFPFSFPLVPSQIYTALKVSPLASFPSTPQPSASDILFCHPIFLLPLVSPMSHWLLCALAAVYPTFGTSFFTSWISLLPLDPLTYILLAILISFWPTSFWHLFLHPRDKCCCSPGLCPL